MQGGSAQGEERTGALSNSARVRSLEDLEDNSLTLGKESQVRGQAENGDVVVDGKVENLSGKEDSREEQTVSAGQADSLPNVEDQKSSWERNLASLDEFRKNLRAASLKKYAGTLGVSVQMLKLMGIGFYKYAYTFPMRDAEGHIVGFRLRPVKGGKLARTDDSLGLFIPDSVNAGNLDTIDEGESDTAAALTLGFNAIGIPGTGHRIEEVVKFLESSPIACPCIIGDSDSSGRDGAEKLAVAVVDAGVPCRVIFSVEPYKDLRQWLVEGHLTHDQLAGVIAQAPIRWPPPGKWPPGFSKIPNAPVRRGLIARVGLGPFALACALRSFQGHDGLIFPPREILAELLGVTISTIDRYKTVLGDAGVISWTSGKTGRANEYRVNFGPERRTAKKN
jgi:hypothetical protein